MMVILQLSVFFQALLLLHVLVTTLAEEEMKEIHKEHFGDKITMG